MINLSMLFFITFLFISTVNYSVGQTSVSGGIFANTTWKKANSPYLITSDVAIYPGFVLTIESGVKVKVTGGKKLIVRGTLLAKGNVKDSIEFSSNQTKPARSQWNGIQIENELGGNVEVSYFNGYHASVFFTMTGNSSGDVLKISHSKIAQNETYIKGYDGGNYKVILKTSLFDDNNNGMYFFQNGSIDSCIFRKGIEGIHSGGQGNFTVSNSEFSEFSGSTFRSGGKFINCNFFNNTNGIKLVPNLEFTDCKIYNNQYGIVVSFPFSFTPIFKNTCVYGNTSYDIIHNFNYNIDMSGIYWKEIDSIKISKKIYDAYDDVSLGIVKFLSSNQCDIITSFTHKNEIKENWNLYPNPTSQYLTLSNQEINLEEVVLISSTGDVVERYEVEKFNNIDISHLKPGVYILEFRTDKSNHFEKVIKY